MFRWLHSIGVALIFVAAALLIVTTVSSPVVNNLAILRVSTTNSSDVTFGSFGYCVRNTAPDNSDLCSAKMIGYKPADVMSAVDGTAFSIPGHATSDGLTHAFVLHPVAAGFAFLAGLVALGGFFGSVAGMLIALVAWLVNVAVMAIDLAVFGIIKDHVNNDGSGSSASFDTAMWTTIAAMVLLLLGTIVVFFTCCTERRKRRSGTYVEPPRQSRWRRHKY